MEKEKRELRIFLAVAYGVPFLMGFLLWYAYARGLDTGLFAGAQMLYPAAGVALAYLVMRRQDEKVPRAFYIIYLTVTVVVVLCTAFSVVLPKTLNFDDGTETSVWEQVRAWSIVLGAIFAWVALRRAGKEKRAAYGLAWGNTKTAFLMIVLFLGLSFLETVIGYVIEEQVLLPDTLKDPVTWVSFILLIPLFFLEFMPFFGEEYGWRYYLQPICQKKFGLRKGTLVLGIVWGLWHAPLDFFYYTTPDNGIVMLLRQMITCVALGIFFAYAYMKTNNVWVPIILHYLNNGMIPIITGVQSSQNITEGQHISWLILPISLLMDGLIFGLFLLSKTFRENRATEA